MCLRYGLRGDLVTLTGQLLDHVVVAVLVRNEERALYGATVRILSLLVEDLLVVVEIVQVDGTVEGHQYHLWHLCNR